MSDRRPDDMESRLRAHYAALPAGPPTLRAADLVGARARRPSRVMRILGVAALVAAVALVMAVVDLASVPAVPDAATAPSTSPVVEPASPATVASADPLPAAGQVLRLTRDFPPAHAGQLLYVVGNPELHEGRERVLVQHWGDLEHGLAPDTTFLTVSADDLAAASTRYEPACPDSVRSILDVARLQPFERLSCFGDGELSFGPVIATDYRVARLTRWLSANGSPDFFDALPLPPASAGQDLPDGTWVEVTGRFDQDWSGCVAPDPIWCREQFVVTSYREVDPPDFVYRGSWRQTLAPTGGRSEHGMAWTGRDVFVWGGSETNADHTVFEPDVVRYGLAYDVGRDAWRQTSPAPVPGRLAPSVEWSGSEVLVWGGREPDETPRRDGAAYDPRRGTWRKLSPAPLTAARVAFARVIEGRLVAVTDTGTAIYDPATDRWTEAAAPPFHLLWPTWAVAGGRLVVIEFGDGASALVQGAVFDPGKATWSELDRASIPVELLEAGGRAIDAGDSIYLPDTGWSLDPASGAWRRLTACQGAANGGVWTGTRILGVRGTYDPVGDRCLQLPEAPPRPGAFATTGREFAVGVWAGSEYMTWSGGTGGDVISITNDGAIFRPEQP